MHPPKKKGVTGVSQKWKGQIADSCRKHTDENDLFTCIRHHTMPFIVPKPKIIEKEASFKDKLEQEIGKKFLAGKHQCAAVLKVAGMIFKPLFLSIILPFYCCFYLVPNWLFANAKVLYQPVACKFGHLSVLFRKKIDKILNPLVVYVNKIKLFVHNFFTKLNSLSAVLRTKPKVALQMNPASFLGKIKDFRLVLSTYFYKTIYKFKNQYRNFEKKLRAGGQSIEKKIEGFINFPFVYLKNQWQNFSTKCADKILVPCRKKFYSLFSRLRAWKKYMHDGYLNLCNALKKHVNFLLIKASDFKNQISSSQLNYKKVLFPISYWFNKIKNNGHIFLRKLSEFNFFEIRQKMKPLVVSWNASKKKIEETYLCYALKVARFKSQVRQFAIHLPSRIRNQIPLLLAKLEKFNEKISFLIQKLKMSASGRLKKLSMLIPAPLGQAVQKCAGVLIKVKSALRIKCHDMLLCIVIIKVWIKVIFKYSKKLITSHQLTKLLSPTSYDVPAK